MIVLHPGFGTVEPCALEEAVDALAVLEFDARDEGKVSSAANWLARLIANRTFLADMLLDRLTGQGKPAVESDYGPQAIVLSPVRGGVFARANIWPAADDLCVRNSGAQSFVYGTPHDHNFSFLTGGYAGPGYVSDHYEYSYSEVTGYPGEEVELQFTRRSTLAEGDLQLYRAHKDVHVQHPPESLSVSLNIMEVPPVQGWFDQYGFHTQRGEVTRLLSSNATEVFLRTVVASGSAEGVDFAEWVGRTHPSERLRLASYEARAGLARGAVLRDDIWREAEANGSRMVAEVAKARREALSLD